MSYTRKSTTVGEDDLGAEGGNNNTYHRTTKLNNYLKECQVVDTSNMIDESTVNVGDFDTLAFKVASSVENAFIEVVFIKDGSKQRFKNVTEFKGALRKEGAIDVKSWLGNLNLKRESKGKKPLTLDMFEIIPKKELKHEDGVVIDDIGFTDSLQVAKYYVDSWISAIKIQTQVDKVLPILGSGDNHRHELPLPVRYKEGRADSERPILLKEVREYILTQYKGKMAPKGFEADEIVDAYGLIGYKDYKKTGKFSYIKSSPDKDACNEAGLLFNYDKEYVFKHPQMVYIPDHDEGVGEIEVAKDKCVGVGLKHLCYQLLIGDSSDGYGPRAYLPEEVRPKLKYGYAAFFQEFYPLETQKEVLQKLVDKYYEWFPEGVAYTAWNGEEVEFTTLQYLELMFSCAYMKVSPKDTRKLEDDLIKYNVDYSMIKSNRINDNSELVGEDVLKDIVHEAKTVVEAALETVEKKSGTKPVLVDSLTKVEDQLKELNTLLRSMFDTGV